MKKELFADPEKCTGCGRCSYVCSAVKTGAFAPSQARILINNFPHRGFSAPSICYQCPGAPCQKSCPAAAIFRDENDVVMIDADKCTTCGECVAACPYGMIGQDSAKLAHKCDLCGGDPACVKECYPAALVYQEKTPELLQLKGAQMKQRYSEGSPAEKRMRLGKALLSLSRD